MTSTGAFRASNFKPSGSTEANIEDPAYGHSKVKCDGYSPTGTWIRVTRSNLPTNCPEDPQKRAGPAIRRRPRSFTAFVSVLPDYADADLQAAGVGAVGEALRCGALAYVGLI